MNNIRRQQTNAIQYKNSGGKTRKFLNQIEVNIDKHFTNFCSVPNQCHFPCCFFFLLSCFLSFYYSSFPFTFPFHFSCTFILYVASLKVIWFWFLGKCSFVQSFCNIDFFFCPFHWITELRMETIITFIFFSCEKYGEQKTGERERKHWFSLCTTEWY